MNEASQNSNISLTRLMDTIENTNTQVQIRPKQIELNTDSNLKKMAAILASEPGDISLEERGYCTDDHKC